MKRLNLLIYRMVLMAVLLACIGIGAGAIEIGSNSFFEESLSFSIRLLLLIVITILLCLSIIMLYHWFDTFSQKQMKIATVIMFAVISAIFLVLLCELHPMPTTDPLHLTNKALEIIDTGEVPIAYTQYFARYKNNYFLTIFFVYFFKLLFSCGIKDVWLPLYLVSTVGIMLSAVFTWLIAVKTGGMRTGVKVLALCVLNPVYYLLAFWVYSHSLAMPFIMGVLYFGICIWKSNSFRQRMIYSIAEAIFATVGYFIRPTSDIPLIALIVCAVMFAVNRCNIRKILQSAVVCTIVALILFQSISAVNHQYFSSVEDGNFPVGHWLMTASHGTGRCNTDDDTYTSGFDTKEERSSATIRKALQNYKSLGISGFVKFEYDKMVVTWSSGDANLNTRIVQDRSMGRLYQWIAGDKDDVFRLYCQAFRLVTMLLIIVTCASLLKSERIDKYRFLYILSFFGGILFYCFWEVKESYSLPFVYIMILIAAYGGCILQKSVVPMAEILCSRKQKMLVISGYVGLLILCVIFYHGLTVKKIKQKDYSVRSVSSLTSAGVDTGDKEETIEQEFYAEKPFNKIRLYVSEDDNNQCIYHAVLMDENGNELYSTDISSEGSNQSKYVVLSLDQVKPNGKQKYVLKLTRQKESEGKMLFNYRATPYVDMYDGVCTINGEETPYDLLLQVYDEQKKPFCSKKAGILISSSLFLAAVLLYLWIHRIHRSFCKSLKEC